MKPSPAKEDDQTIIALEPQQTLHGGAWKVAYADFVTAMMAFFLLLWLLSSASDEQLTAIATYFDPTHPKVSVSESGAGGVLGGLTAAVDGAMVDQQQPMVNHKKNKDTPGKEKSENKADAEQEKKNEARRKAEEERFEKATKEIKQAIQDNPDLKALEKNIIIDMTPEGLRIQIVDQDGEPMFPSGSAQMFEKTRNLLVMITGVIQKLPNELSVRGHTDSTPYGPGATYTNWELSSDRANASRRVMLDSNLEAERINNVMGKADTEHLIPEEPQNAQNRRISIILLKEELTNPDLYKSQDAEANDNDNFQDIDPSEDNTTQEDVESLQTPRQVPIGTFKRTPGQVEFP